MTTDLITAWQKAALDATMAYAQSALAGAEQILKLNLETAQTALQQNTTTVRELMSASDPQQLAALRNKLAQVGMQQTANYAQHVYEIVSQTQAHLAKLAEEQFTRINQDMMKNAESLSKNAPGAEVALAAVKSTVAASAAMLDTFNRAAKQFAELSEASIKSATSGMVRGAGEK